MKIALRIIGVLALVISIIWLIAQPGFEPLVTFLTGLATLLGSFFVPKEEKARETLKQRNRRVLLNHVENFWVKGILEKSLHGAALIELGMRQNPQAISYPWEIRRHSPDETLPPGRSIFDIFEEVGFERSLLILGEPGSGKTTMLLELARHMVVHARQSEGKPIPIVFNLSSWTEKQKLEEWLIDQLHSFYKVPKVIGQSLIVNEELILLLDGLDEVKRECRGLCASAINLFHKEHGLISLVVSSRSKEYEEIDTQLELEGAIEIQPLTPDQVNSYFAQFGDRLADLRHLLEEDASLYGLTETPLVLSVMALAYLDANDKDIQLSGNIEEQHRYLFDAYIARMFERTTRSQFNPYQRQAVVHLLAWLARKMIQHNQVPFLIERLQPNWLTETDRKSLYRIASLAIGGLSCGLITCLIGSLIGVLSFGLISGLELGLVSALLGVLVGGLIGGLSGGINRKGGQVIEIVDTLSWSWRGALRRTASGVKSGLISGVITGLLGGILVTLIGLQSRGWVELVSGTLLGAVVGSLISALVFGLTSGFRGGLSFRQIDETTTPNQGIKQSATNALLVFLVVGPGSGLLVGMVVEVLVRLSGQSGYGVIIGVLVGLSGGLISGLMYGGFAAIQHCALRVLLNRSRHIPFRLAALLDCASDLILLRKIGGGYIFIHRLLMEYFADMDI